MGVYTGFVDGYAFEAIWGTSPITDEADIMYSFGLLSKEAIHPSPECSVIYAAPGLNELEVDESLITKGPYTLSGTYIVAPFNGILLKAAMGKSTTTEAGGVYTHTIVVPTAVDNVLPPLPSFTIQHEMTGTATDWATQFTGCKINQLEIQCDYKRRVLIFVVDWLAKKAAKVAFTLTNTPDFPTGTNDEAYVFANMTRTFDGSDLDGLIGLKINISSDITGEYAHTYTTGTYDGMWPYLFTEGSIRKYEVSLEYTPGSSTIWEELIATSNTKDLVFKWTRSANDYIQITCSDCKVIEHTMKTPEIGKELREQVKMIPASISIVVKDGIAGGYYNE